ncbi:uncharacterized protein LOC133199785 [Saccostrea echinata]|uniref:uncharacterized protein LOC133199785 n=1 Tax=Saccostrea echinata TaxID=191078 RepID=UPI002A831336|nr:uncharacterized protein LOC133199785 [Saccostrea echinata]
MSHFNFYLKLNTKRSRRKLCQIPSLLSSHPHIDNTSEDGLRSLPSRTHMKCASRGLKDSDILHLIGQAGITLPVNTPCCTMCLKKIREHEEGEDHLFNMECSASDKDKTEAEAIKMEECSETREQPSDKDPLFHSGSKETSETNSSQSFTLSHDIQHLNEYLKKIGEREFSEDRKYQWDSYTKSAKSYYIKRFRNIMSKLIAVIFPKNIEEIVKSLTVSEENPKVSSSIIHEGSFGPLIHAYQTSETWRHRRQILSFFTQTLSFKEAKSLLPNMTESMYYAAKNHAKNVGPGLPVNTTSTRKRMDPVKLDNFLDFITSPHVIRDLPYGERKIKLSDGTTYEMPNVIRCMGSSDVIQQYKAYCSENNISPLGDSTMYRILSECGAQIRTSLEGVDYFIAEGGRAFHTILDTLEELLKFQFLNQQEKKDFYTLFLQCKQYLHADFKTHISPDSKVADHCQTYALSDPLHPEFAAACQHPHDLVCVTCEQMKDAISSLMKTIQCSSNHGLTDFLSDLHFKLQNATRSITNLKRRLIRCRNQDAAKSDLFNTMQSNEVLLICDWSMKYLPRKYREDQSDWFGKRGLPWHITVAFHKMETSVESLGFVHIFQSQISQDSMTTAAIIIDVMENIQSIDASISSFHV